MRYLRRIDEFWSKQSWFVALIIGFACIVALAFVDFLTGFEVSFALFYTLPICFVAWYAGERAAVVVSVASALAWEEGNRFAGQTYSSPFIPYWNAATRLGFFLVIAVLICLLKQTLERERALSRVDFLTGAKNRRAFIEVTRTELVRSHRYSHPLTIAYIDLDNFKSVNDRFGHHTGDALLSILGKALLVNLRVTDTVGRLGGDEFGILLPETDSGVAKGLIDRIHQILLDEMRQNKWPVTFSVGVLTCLVTPETAEEMIKMADELMYGIKNSSKNAIKYSLYAG